MERCPMQATLKRSFETEAFNALANDPCIRPTIGGDPSQSLDLETVVTDGRNICFLGEYGGFVFNWTSPGCYEVHTLVRTEGRGAWAASAAKAVLEVMGLEYGARQVWTRIKTGMRNVRAFAVAAGLRPCGLSVFDIGQGPQSFNLYEKVY